MNSLIQVILKEGIAYIEINRPEFLNAINQDLMVELKEFFSSDPDPQISGIIIKGGGEKAFVAGADITEFTNKAEAEAAEMSRLGHQTFKLISEYSKPVIAVVNGYALGGGCELAMSCHLRVATKSAVFGLPELKLGLVPGFGGIFNLIKLIGKAKALEYILTGKRINAEEALNLGLVNVVKDDMVSAEDWAEEVIRLAAKNGPKAIKETLSLAALDLAYDEYLEKEAQQFGKLMASEEAKEGISAFIEKRSPNFIK